MISILCPTRKRPIQFSKMVDSCISTSSFDRSVSIFTASIKEDMHSYDYSDTLAYIMPDGMPTAHKWNLLAEEALRNPANKLFMLGSDDMLFTTPEWDIGLIDHYNALENKIHVYALQDSRDINGTPHIIVTREYIEAMGYFVPPIFLHWYVDSWTVEIAKANDCFTHLRNYELQHIKPSDKGQGDETHSRIREWGWHARDKWVNDKMQHLLSDEKQRLTDIIMGNV